MILPTTRFTLKNYSVSLKLDNCSASMKKSATKKTKNRPKWLFVIDGRLYAPCNGEREGDAPPPPPPAVVTVMS